jgi:hypothetical protein
MLKALAVAVFLLPTLMLAQDTKPSAATFTTPQIVAKGKLRNQSTPIPSMTIFTPPQDGLYRLSVYATITQADSSSRSSFMVGANYSDDSGVEQTLYQLLVGTDSLLGQFSIYLDSFYSSGGPTVTFEAKSGTAISINVTQQGPPDASKYSLYYTLERLE